MDFRGNPRVHIDGAYRNAFGQLQSFAFDVELDAGAWRQSRRTAFA
jgi:hypothetical protein